MTTTISIDTIIRRPYPWFASEEGTLSRCALAASWHFSGGFWLRFWRSEELVLVDFTGWDEGCKDVQIVKALF